MFESRLITTSFTETGTVYDSDAPEQGPEPTIGAMEAELADSDETILRRDATQDKAVLGQRLVNGSHMPPAARLEGDVDRLALGGHVGKYRLGSAPGQFRVRGSGVEQEGDLRRTRQWRGHGRLRLALRTSQQGDYRQDCQKNAGIGEQA